MQYHEGTTKFAFKERGAIKVPKKKIQKRKESGQAFDTRAAGIKISGLTHCEGARKKKKKKRGARGCSDWCTRFTSNVRYCTPHSALGGKQGPAKREIKWRPTVPTIAAHRKKRRRRRRRKKL